MKCTYSNKQVAIQRKVGSLRKCTTKSTAVYWATHLLLVMQLLQHSQENMLALQCIHMAEYSCLSEYSRLSLRFPIIYAITFEAIPRNTIWNVCAGFSNFSSSYYSIKFAISMFRRSQANIFLRYKRICCAMCSHDTWQRDNLCQEWQDVWPQRTVTIYCRVRLGPKIYDRDLLPPSSKKGWLWSQFIVNEVIFSVKCWESRWILWLLLENESC